MNKKQCRRCLEVKPFELFANNKQHKDGRDSYCKECRNKWAQEHSEQMVENAARWNKDHPEEAKKHKAKYQKNHREKLTLLNKVYRLLNIEKSRASSNRWKKEHPEYWKNRRAREKGSGEKITEQEINEMKKKYNYTCLRCGLREPEIKLTHDHVLPLSKGGKNTIENSQPLCKSCNSIKGAKHIDYRSTHHISE